MNNRSLSNDSTSYDILGRRKPTSRRKPIYQTPNRWTIAGVEGLTFAIAAKAVSDGADPDGRWKRHLECYMDVDDRQPWEHGDRDRFRATKLG